MDLLLTVAEPVRAGAVIYLGSLLVGLGLWSGFKLGSDWFGNLRSTVVNVWVDRAE